MWPALVYGLAASLLVVAWAVVGDAWWLQPFNLTTFWWTLPAVVLALFAVLARRWGIVVALAVPALVWLWSYGTLFLPGGSPEEPADLTVATFNTYVAAPDEAHVLALVDDVDPDVLLLQEVFPPRQAALQERLSDHLPHSVTVQSEGVGGVMVASRHPIVEEVPVSSSVEGVRDTVVVVIEVDGRRVQVVPAHLRSPCPTCGASVTDRLTVEGRSRAVETASILGSLHRGTPAIVGGDFNSTERSVPYRSLVGAGFRDPQREAGSGPGFTWPADGGMPFPMFRIDWLLSRGLVPVAAWVGESGASDHRPVVATFSFEEAP